ncbi:hypothetical protein Taro_008722 [Colocasia esculenta]|uniref:Uncharacterized protein n=1 Tax=Colocasia esculenta TaxID=4460 RepID=A0A843U7S6_COLES|nr:hypothetical protein [Colocasia esculenta]
MGKLTLCLLLLLAAALVLLVSAKKSADVTELQIGVKKVKKKKAQATSGCSTRRTHLRVDYPEDPTSGCSTRRSPTSG